jgi:hypothetical protein
MLVQLLFNPARGTAKKNGEEVSDETAKSE